MLKSEFAGLFLTADNALKDGSYKQTNPTDYRIVTVPSGLNIAFVSEHKLDLSGYAMEDLTVYFRSSFEQRGGSTNVSWEVSSKPVLANQVVFQEATILSSVPMSDENLVNLIYTMPGFIPFTFNFAGINPGNFDRTHIIHGSQLVWGVDSAFGGDAFSDTGNGYSRVVQANEFSSLEPTAADCIYCYRFVNLPQSYYGDSDGAGLSTVLIPPKRVLLDATTNKEPDLEYLMRLKRSYELANQV